MDNDDGAEGVWGHIVSLVPRPEIPEIEQLVGSTLIETNHLLWRELKAFNSILTELHTLEFDQPLLNERERQGPSSTMTDALSLPLSAANLEASRKEISAIPSLALVSLPANQDQQHENGSNPPLTRRSNFSGDSMDFIFAIEQHLSVERIVPVLEDIRRALQSEKSELEAEIALLMSAMDGESDSVAARQVETAKRGSSSQQPAATGATSLTSAGAESPGDASAGPRSGLGGSGVCASCARVHEHSYQPGRIRKSSSSSAPQQLCFTCLEKEHQQRKMSGADKGTDKGAGAGAGSSRFRSKLQAARDEHHFLEDF